MSEIEKSVHHRFADVGGLRLHYVEAGPADGPLVVLLHGFPEFWYGWRHQIQPLAEAGYRVVALDQRGYNESDKLRAVTAYTLDRLAGDVTGLLDALGRPTAHLVGHDWGGIVGWWLALTQPERLARLAVLNAPHPSVFLRVLRRNPAQMLRSWYALFFQLPWLPEALARAHDWRLASAALRRSGRPHAFSADDVERYRRAWSQPGAFTAMLHWYRAAARYPPRRLANERVAVPTLVLWGAQDVSLGRELVPPSLNRCDDGRLVLVEEASHWVQHEEAPLVNRELVAFLRA